MRLTVQIEVTPAQVERLIAYLQAYHGPEGDELCCTAELDAQGEIDALEARDLLIRLTRMGCRLGRPDGEG